MIEETAVIAGAIGLSTAAGLNAYLPLLLVGLAARFTGLVRLGGPWDILTNGWVLAALTILLLIEMAVDKVPGADTLNDGIQTIGRPLAGAILFAADSGMFGATFPVPALIAGLLIAGAVHMAKSMARPVITVITGGLCNWLVSLLEDGVSFVLAVVAILVPLAVLLLIALLAAAYLAGRRAAGGTPG